jgi:tryptophan-rich sensory protein
LLYHSTTLPWFEDGLKQFVLGLKAVIFIGFSIFCLTLFGKAMRKGKSYSAGAMIHDSLLVALLAVCVVSSKFHPWYVLMFFPVALWLPEDSNLRRLAVVLSCTQLLAITYLCC